ncbi:MAG: dicarboxylate/amino acid:cation symporter [Pirellulaceae bacterium]|nr:dicarboxylate/amino acid:cation symporter [Pirellulaceae bacterium]
MPDTSQDRKPHGTGRLTLFIAVAIVAAIILAGQAPQFAAQLDIGGEIFLRLLKMMVVPLVVTSVMSGILGMGDIRKLGKPGGTAVVYYLATTLLAVFVGLIVVNTIRPGEGEQAQQALKAMRSSRGVSTDEMKQKISQHLADAVGVETEEVQKVMKELSLPEDPKVGTVLKNLVLMLFTDNLFQSAARGDLLPLIFFSIIFAGMLTTLGDRVAVLTGMIDQANEALMSFVMLLMKIAPLGIFCLVAARFGEAQAKGELYQRLQEMGWYMGTVLIGLSIHALITLPLILYFMTRRNPYRFIYQMLQALLTAFSTASSSATLPVTMECATKNAKVSDKSVEFVLPLGATVNMDGTALYEAVAAIFIAQLIGKDLVLAEQIIVALTATLAAIGAAGIPQAGLVTMLIVLSAVGLPLEMVGLILSVDWLLDRFRTAVNVLGDAMGAAVVERTLVND